MNQHDFKIAIENSEQYKGYPNFKKGLTMKHNNIMRLLDLFGQAERLGLPYLKQNVNLFASDYNLIEELINNK